MKLRQANHQDSNPIIALIDEVYQEYGDRIFLEGYDADLLDLKANYSDQGGCFVVLEHDSKIIGCHATFPLNRETGQLTLRRLYLKAAFRGGEAASLLMQWALEWARCHRFCRIDFWSDTRFTRAHRFFEKHGFTQTGAKRDLDDAAEPYSEFEFTLNL